MATERKRDWYDGGKKASAKKDGEGDGDDGPKVESVMERHARERDEANARHAEARDTMNKAHEAELKQLAERHAGEAASGTPGNEAAPAAQQSASQGAAKDTPAEVAGTA